MAAIAEPLDVFHKFYMDQGAFIGGAKPSIADMRLAATLEFLAVVDYDLPAWAKKYMAAKRRQKGHSDPLVWSGESRGRALAKRIRSTRTWGKATIDAPTLNRMPRKGRRFKMSEEVTRVTDKEFRSMLNHMEKKLTKELQDAGKRKT
jgi:hypothetical protein